MYRLRAVALVQSIFRSRVALVSADLQARLLAQRRVTEALAALLCLTLRPAGVGIVIAETSIPPLPPMVPDRTCGIPARTHGRSSGPAQLPMESPRSRASRGGSHKGPQEPSSRDRDRSDLF